MDNTIIYATRDNDPDTTCFPKYIILGLKWLIKGPKHIAKLQTSYFDLCTVHINFSKPIRLYDIQAALKNPKTTTTKWFNKLQDLVQK